MRAKPQDRVLLFNGSDGEWLAELSMPTKKKAVVLPLEQTRQQTTESGPTLYFAPIRKEHMSWLIQKATELGVSKLCPVKTERTAHPHFNPDRLHSIAVEAAEQSRRLTVPAIGDALPLSKIPAGFFYLDETGHSPMISKTDVPRTGSFVLGPEGGFSDREFDFLQQNGTGVSLGPLTLRAETAGLTVLAYLVCRQ